MTPELFIASKASEAIKALYNADIEPSALQVSVTRKEFTGDFTLVVFPLLRLSHSTPENTGNAIDVPDKMVALDPRGWFLELADRLFLDLADSLSCERRTRATPSENG